MNYKEVLVQFLDLMSPWKISDVQVDYGILQVCIRVSYPKGERASCPECEKSYPIYDLREGRKWIHLDTMQFKAIIHCNIPRIECSICGIKSISVSWADVESYFMLLFKRLAVDVLLGYQN